MKKAAVPSILVVVVLLALGVTAEAEQAERVFRDRLSGQLWRLEQSPAHSGKAYGTSVTSRVRMSLLNFEREEANPDGPELADELRAG